MKKRILLWLMIVMLAASFSVGYADSISLPKELATPASSDLTEKEAAAIAQAEVMQRQSLSSEAIQKYLTKPTFVLLSDGTKAWAVTLFSDAFNDPTDTSVLISSPDAMILSVEETKLGWFQHIREQWEADKGAFGTWSLEDKALFDKLYTQTDDYIVPGEDMLSQEEASKIALRVLPGPLVSPVFQYAFSHNTSAAGSPAEYVWMVTVLIDGAPKYQVNLSGVDGTVYDVLDVNIGRG